MVKQMVDVGRIDAFRVCVTASHDDGGRRRVGDPGEHLIGCELLVRCLLTIEYRIRFTR